MNDEIRQIVRQHGRLLIDASKLTDETNLFDAGMTSHASVNVMLALEGAFEIEFPERMLKRSVFESIGAISAAVEELMATRS